MIKHGLVALLALTTVALSMNGCGKQADKKSAPPPIKVGIATVRNGDIVQTFPVSGTLKFNANTTVSSEVAAQVKSLEANDGQFVRSDEVLLIFDETKIKETANQALANLRKNEATLAFNKVEWEKNLELFKSGSVSTSRYEEKLSGYQNSLAQVDADKAFLAKAMEDLKKTKVRSPIAGVLSNRYVEKGDWVSEGGRIFVISEYDPIFLEAYLSDMDVGRLPVRKVRAEGVPVEIKVDSLPDKTFDGALTYIQPLANDSRLFQIRIYLHNPDMVLLQGMVARGAIVFNRLSDVPRIPLQALLDPVKSHSANSVFRVDAENKANLTRIKIGTINEQFAELQTGLKDGDSVVVQGKDVLTSGQPLEIVEALPGASELGRTSQK